MQTANETGKKLNPELFKHGKYKGKTLPQPEVWISNLINTSNMELISQSRLV